MSQITGPRWAPTCSTLTQVLQAFSLMFAALTLLCSHKLSIAWSRQAYTWECCGMMHERVSSNKTPAADMNMRLWYHLPSITNKQVEHIMARLQVLWVNTVTVFICVIDHRCTSDQLEVWKKPLSSLHFSWCRTRDTLQVKGVIDKSWIHQLEAITIMLHRCHCISCSLGPTSEVYISWLTLNLCVLQHGKHQDWKPWVLATLTTSVIFVVGHVFWQQRQGGACNRRKVYAIKLYPELEAPLGPKWCLLAAIIR